MGEEPRGVRRVVASTRTFVASRPRTQKLGGVAAVLLLATAPFGGLAKASDPPPSRPAADAVMQVGPYSFQVLRTRTIDSLAPALPAPGDGVQQLAIVARVRNTTDEPQYPVQLAEALKIVHGQVLHDEDGSEVPPDYFVLADGQRPTVLNPGVTYDLVFAYKQRAGWADDTVRLAVAPVDYREEDPLTLAPRQWWVEDGVAAELTLPVKPAAPSGSSS